MKLIAQLLVVGFLAGCGVGTDGTAQLEAVSSGAVGQALNAGHGHGHGHAAFKVKNVDFYVDLPGIGNHLKVATRVYEPHNGKARSVVQLALHGATYDGRYWEIPEINGVSYSYAEDMASRGYIVVVMDQLGAGQSDKPDGDLFGLAEAGSALYQVGEQIRQHIGKHRALVYVGHSNGSVTSLWSQGIYGGADAVITTGWVHGYRGLPVDPNDPVFQQALSTPYIHLPGEARQGLFYFPPQTDPDLIAYDNANLNNAMPRHQFLDLIGVHADITNLGPGGMTTLTKTQLITVPVLVQAGNQDFAIAPASTVNDPPTEAGFFPSSPSVTVQSLDQMGHSFNGHFTHDESWDAIDAWLTATFP
ncbi:MAG: alpha/beta hydrolase [Myxococcaceae bacterium]|nr:alpha/beta hydrolase [Myxococcaceae bacterium]